MTRRSPGPRVVLTGATSGIGRATALTLARDGCSLVLGARRRDVLEQVAAECRSLGAGAVAVACDVSRAPDVDALARVAVEQFDGFDVWVNNAGVLAIGSVHEMPPAALARVVEVNLVGTMLGTRAAVAHFKDRGAGSIVNVGSVLSAFPAGYAAAYAASKHGVDGFARAVRQELVHDRHIRVCNVLPAGVDTPILDHAGNYSGRAIRPYYPLVPPERVARAIARCIERPRATVIVGATGRAQTFIDAVAPWLHRRIVASATTGALRRASPDDVTDGALFDPAPGRDDAVSGGWRRSRLGAKVAAGSVAATVAYAATYLAARRRATHEGDRRG